jgi:hypothetical protein
MTFVRHCSLLAIPVLLAGACAQSGPSDGVVNFVQVDPVAGLQGEYLRGDDVVRFETSRYVTETAGERTRLRDAVAEDSEFGVDATFVTSQLRVSLDFTGFSVEPAAEELAVLTPDDRDVNLALIGDAVAALELSGSIPAAELAAFGRVGEGIVGDQGSPGAIPTHADTPDIEDVCTGEAGDLGFDGNETIVASGGFECFSPTIEGVDVVLAACTFYKSCSGFSGCDWKPIDCVRQEHTIEPGDVTPFLMRKETRCGRIRSDGKKDSHEVRVFAGTVDEVGDDRKVSNIADEELYGWHRLDEGGNSEKIRCGGDFGPMD